MARSELRESSPLDGRCFEGRALVLRESKAFNFVQAKGRRLAPDALSYIGADPPPGTCEEKIAWVGPDERLLIDAKDPGLVLAQLDISPSKGCFARNATSGLIAIEVEGQSSRRLLQGETGSIEFTPGFAARLRIADLPVLVLVRAPDHLLCLVERSVARWLFDWLVDRAEVLNL